MKIECTPARIEASRAGGARSRGPVIEARKAVSSRNNAGHGLLSSSALITGESKEEFDRLLTSQILEFDLGTNSGTPAGRRNDRRQPAPDARREPDGRRPSPANRIPA